MMRKWRWFGARKGLVVSVVVAGGVALPGLAWAVTGICPDGSLYIVQKPSQIPCNDSKQVRPDEVPPVRPEYRPTPYTWDVWNRNTDPNNPYNLIDAARQVREFQEALPDTPHAPGLAAPPPTGRATAEVPLAAATRSVGPLDLGLDDQELRDLYRIVELSQEQSPAHIARRTADGKGVFEVAWARSAAFESVLRRAWSSRGGLGGGSVVVFTGRSKRPESFFANFTVVQGHLSYQPDAHDPRQLGILQGRLGDLAGGEIVMGYVVLPDAIALEQDLDLFWNDRRVRARLGGRRSAQR
ncbi:MAG: hypothetical protein CL910_10805 [Deltaproteobacteria bacterium]|nr:hypothetical protein [Deltaproteobacteria bacterium]